MRTNLDQAPQATRLLTRTTFALTTVAIGMILLIISGIFDPQPLGSELTSLVPGPAGIPAHATTINWLDTPTLSLPYTIRLSGRYQSGEMDIGYGLVTGDTGHSLVIAVSPLGYVSIWETSGGELTNHLPWQTWPHVRAGSAENEIWLDYDGLEATVRLNRELLWSGMVDGLEGRIGVYGESFGEPAGVNFSSLAIFQ